MEQSARAVENWQAAQPSGTLEPFPQCRSECRVGREHDGRPVTLTESGALSFVRVQGSRDVGSSHSPLAD
jgi:hypothetical protein